MVAGNGETGLKLFDQCRPLFSGVAQQLVVLIRLHLGFGPLVFTEDFACAVFAQYVPVVAVGVFVGHQHVELGQRCPELLHIVHTGNP